MCPFRKPQWVKRGKQFTLSNAVYKPSTIVCTSGIQHPFVTVQKPENEWKQKEITKCYSRNLPLEEAIAALEEGRHQNPSVSDFGHILHQCRSRDRLHAAQLYDCMQKYGMANHTTLGNHLLHLLLEVGCINEAHELFVRLVHRSERSWNSLIITCVKHGKLQLALNLYKDMQKQGNVHMDIHAYVALIKACRKMKDWQTGMKINEELSNAGMLKKDAFIGSALIDLQSKFGKLGEAQNIFNEIIVQDKVSWTSLIAGYSEHGQAEEALKRFQQMQLNGLFPDAVTYVCVLKVCTGIRDKKKGQQLHLCIKESGLLEREVNVGNALIDMYGKCGSLDSAFLIFDKLSLKDVVSWTSLIKGHTEHGNGIKALDIFDEMDSVGMVPNSVTFLCSLQACGLTKHINKGREIHAEIERRGFITNEPLLGNSLVDMYAKCDMFSMSYEVLRKLPARDVVSWTALISGYAQSGHGEEAIKCFDQMKFEGGSPNIATYVSVLKACSSIKAISKGCEIHEEMKKMPLLDRDPTICTSLIDMYSKCGLIGKAIEVINNSVTRDVTSWNALINGCAEYGHGEQVHIYVSQMMSEGICPDDITYLCVLKACGSIGAKTEGLKLHAQIEGSMHLKSHILINTLLVDVHAKCGMLSNSLQLFDGLPNRDVVLWTALISGYVEHGCPKDAIKCFEKMQFEGVFPNSATFIWMLKACAAIGAIEKGQEIHREIERKGLLASDIGVANTLIDMYCKCGSLDLAHNVFENLLSRDVVSWNSLMKGFAQVGDIGNVLFMFEKMLAENIEPNSVTFLIILASLNHVGLFRTTWIYLETMSQEFGIIPCLEHYNSMVDLLCRSGQLDKAIGMVEKTTQCSDTSIWRVILSGCRNYQSIDTGQLAFRNVVHGLK